MSKVNSNSLAAGEWLASKETMVKWLVLQQPNQSAQLTLENFKIPDLKLQAFLLIQLCLQIHMRIS